VHSGNILVHSGGIGVVCSAGFLVGSGGFWCVLARSSGSWSVFVVFWRGSEGAVVHPCALLVPSRGGVVCSGEVLMMFWCVLVSFLLDQMALRCGLVVF
jgi:hypothetical protein